MGNTRLLFGFMLAFLLAPAALLVPKTLFASVGRSFTLPCDGDPGKDVEWHFRQLEQDRPVRLLMAELNTRGLSPGSGFQGRLSSVHLTKPGNYGLTLSHVEYRDHGIYQCQYKNGAVLSDFKLEVQVPLVIPVPMGKDARLPCYVNIDGRARADELDVRWSRGQDVVYRLFNNTVTYGPGFENRTSLSPEQALKGDMGLTIRQTRPSDEGKYRCISGWQQNRGNPDSVELVFAASVGCPAQWGWILLAVILSAVTLALVVLGGLKFLKKQEHAGSYQTTHADEQNESNGIRFRDLEQGDYDTEPRFPVSESAHSSTQPYLLKCEKDSSPTEPQNEE